MMGPASSMPWKKSPANPASPRDRANAPLLRRTQTEPEKRLWWHLRHRLPVAGSHFRRQVPIGAYVADFCCLAARLIVEVDGDRHGFDAQAAYDARRTDALAAQGFRILRFTNADVMRDVDVVLDTIVATLAEPGATRFPTFHASPHGGEHAAET
ncbi:endonuclease domain-containing protein [Methylobacterium trifolii]